jgi:glycerophosphoryl diester phosphodiesterase
MKYSIVRQAHRGFSGLYPENTMLSFRKAIEEGTEFLEMDLHLTKDRKVIIIHDETYDRTTNGTGWVWDMDLKDVKNLDAGQGEKIPTLLEIIDFARPIDIRLCLELKFEHNTSDPSRAEPEAMETAAEVIKILRQTNFLDSVVVTSFSANVLKRVKEIEPRLSIVLTPSPYDGSLSPKQVMDQVVPCANVAAYYYKSIDKAFMDEARLAGITIWAWDPDKPEDILRMINLGVSAVESNRPDILNKVLSEIHSIPIE